MQARFITAEQLEAAAALVGVAVVITTLNAKGDRHRVKVNPLGAIGERKYQRISLNMDGSERRVFAVCWHGFRDFFRACYAVAPDAVFRTALDVWDGSADFEARFPASGHVNIGSQFQPLMTADACQCPDRGMAC